MCDFERRRIAKLLPDRDIATVAAWLRDHPGLGVISRDRGGGYGADRHRRIAAIEAGVPLLVEARVLLDRFHSMIRKKLADNLETADRRNQSQPHRVLREWH